MNLNRSIAVRIFVFLLVFAALSASPLSTITPAKADPTNLWKVSTYYASNLNGHGAGNHAMWCGDSTLPSCAPYDSVGGVSHSMHEDLVWIYDVPNAADSVTVRVTARVNIDLPDIGWDFLKLFVARADSEDVLFSYTGTVDDLALDLTTTVLPAEYTGELGNQVRLTFRVISDAGWDDEDCFAVGHGAAQIDDITVYFDDQPITFDDFEAASPQAWWPDGIAVTGIGDSPMAQPLVARAVPNPFNPSTRIEFMLPSRGDLHVSIYDLQGRLVRHLLARDQPAGRGSVVWDGRDESGRTVGSGVYAYRVDANAEIVAGKVALLK